MFEIFSSTNSSTYDSKPTDLYQYKVYIGEQTVPTNHLSSYWYVDGNTVVSKTGDGLSIDSTKMCVEIYGYTPEHRTSTFSRGTDLPYINGCSTKQLIPPVRPGDPTFQMLCIPPYTSEQAHHIHATPRIVYVAQGEGKSIVGTPENMTEYKLTPGAVVILDKMTPHHFKTTDKELIVLPIHIFSSIHSAEFDHPMYNGTHKV
jgi:quercetin dioxygenase-like cupin family protein